MTDTTDTPAPAPSQPAAGPRRRPDVTLQVVGREAILHDESLRRTHVINGTAAYVWEQLDGRPVPVVASDVAEHFGQPVEPVLADVERLVGRFQAMGLLE